MFQSATRLPYLYGYEGAKKWHDKIKPLRSGSRMGRRPLGGRRDVHMYIRENAQGDIECVLYETPVVVFKQDGGVVVTPGKWPSSFTCAFITGLLPDTSANRTRGTLILHLNRGQAASKHPLREDMSIELVRIPVEPNHPGRWEVRNAEGVRVWAPNRAKANNVRAKYKEMLNYHKGMVALLTQEREKSNEDDPFEAKKILALPKTMLADTLGVMKRMEWQYLGQGQRREVEHAYVNTQVFAAAVNNKPTWSATYYEVGSPEHDTQQQQYQKRRADWYSKCHEVLDLMRSDQPEETKHANFLKASMGLMCAASGVRSFSMGIHATNIPVELSYSTASTAVSKFLTLVFAEEIMELKQMPVGHVPTTHYAEMLFDDFRKQGEGK